MKRFAVPLAALAAFCPLTLAQDHVTETAATPAMSETEHEAVFASAVNTERRYRTRLARLRRLRDIARTQGNQRRIHELEQLMDDNHRRHELRIRRLTRMVDGDARRDLIEAVSDGRQDGVDWARPQPSVADATVRRHVRIALQEKQQNHPGRQVHRAAQQSLITRQIAPEAPNHQLESLRPELRRHLTRLKNQKQVDREAKRISTAAAEAEYQLLRQELTSRR